MVRRGAYDPQPRRLADNPGTIRERPMTPSLTLPQTAPVMILPDCNFFPFTPLPLHIFEPRYRMMLALALESDRMFCLGTRMSPLHGQRELPVDEEAGIYVHGTIGLVRACVTAPDGTSNLILEGVQRVLFTNWIREEPYRIAVIQGLDTHVEDEARVEASVRRVLAMAAILAERGVRCPPHLDLQMDSSLPRELIADVIAHYFLTDVGERHELLAMECLEDRLESLAERLKGVLGALGPQE